MAVLIEGISVVVRRAAVDRRPGGRDVHRDRATGESVTIARPPAPEDDHGR